MAKVDREKKQENIEIDQFGISGPRQETCVGLTRSGLGRGAMAASEQRNEERMPKEEKYLYRLRKEKRFTQTSVRNDHIKTQGRGLVAEADLLPGKSQNVSIL